MKKQVQTAGNHFKKKGTIQNKTEEIRFEDREEEKTSIQELEINVNLSM